MVVSKCGTLIDSSRKGSYVAIYVVLRAGTNLCGIYCIAYFYWNVLQDLILLESLQKFQNCGRLDIAHFVVERLFRQDSFSRAMRMTAGNTHLRAFTRSIMNDKFPPLQEEHVAEVATPSVGRTRSLRGDSTAPISVQGYPVSSQSDELNRQEFFYESPIFDSGTVLESVKLFRVCHEQVISDVLKFVIAF
jgi:hypothetical protein